MPFNGVCAEGDLMKLSQISTDPERRALGSVRAEMVVSASSAVAGVIAISYGLAASAWTHAVAHQATWARATAARSSSLQLLRGLASSLPKYARSAAQLLLAKGRDEGDDVWKWLKQPIQQGLLLGGDQIFVSNDLTSVWDGIDPEKLFFSPKMQLPTRGILLQMPPRGGAELGIATHSSSFVQGGGLTTGKTQFPKGVDHGDEDESESAGERSSAAAHFGTDRALKSFLQEDRALRVHMSAPTNHPEQYFYSPKLAEEEDRGSLLQYETKSDELMQESQNSAARSDSDSSDEIIEGSGKVEGREQATSEHRQGKQDASDTLVVGDGSATPSSGFSFSSFLQQFASAFGDMIADIGKVPHDPSKKFLAPREPNPNVKTSEGTSAVALSDTGEAVLVARPEEQMNEDVASVLEHSKEQLAFLEDAEGTTGNGMAASDASFTTEMATTTEIATTSMNVKSDGETAVARSAAAAVERQRLAAIQQAPSFLQEKQLLNLDSSPQTEYVFVFVTNEEAARFASLLSVAQAPGETSMGVRSCVAGKEDAGVQLDIGSPVFLLDASGSVFGGSHCWRAPDARKEEVLRKAAVVERGINMWRNGLSRELRVLGWSGMKTGRHNLGREAARRFFPDQVAKVADYQTELKEQGKRQAVQTRASSFLEPGVQEDVSPTR
ncbi:unnamed protein product [Amoebophrya sp. A120]|nr:unnamed protein product [Amoebophrya sp. A120]|eukprot:GSA120T00006266001.1